MIFLLKNFIYIWSKYEIMRYKDIIIKCKNNQEFIELQKHLFRLSYSWWDYDNKNRQIKKGTNIEFKGYHFHILIKNDDRIRRTIIPNELELYKIVDFTRYAIFHSSHEHYWGILDTPLKNINEIFTEPNWKVCNDQNYVSFCMSQNKILIRGIYENCSRKPHQYEINGKLSRNFHR